MIFSTRRQAGELLADKLSAYRGSGVLVLGLARGGIEVASVLGSALNLKFDALVIKKIQSPNDPELAIGALAPDGISFVNWKLTHSAGADEAYIKTQIANLNVQIRQQIHLYRKGKPPLTLRNKTVIVVDDGAATGATITAAVKWLKKKHARKIIIAIPVAPFDFLAKLKPEVDELVVLETPEEFNAVGPFYEDFPQITDEKVLELLQNRDL